MSLIYFKSISESNKTAISLSGYLTTNKVKIEAKQYYNGTSMDLPGSNCDVEEADTRTYLLTKMRLQLFYQMTDVCVLQLHCMYTFEIRYLDNFGHNMEQEMLRDLLQFMRCMIHLDISKDQIYIYIYIYIYI